MSTVFYTATTLDGFLADEADSLDWLFRQPQDDTDSPFDYDVFINTVSALAMGATTYEWVRTSGLGDDAWPYSQPTWVFTHRELEPIPGADLRFTSAPVEQVHAEMSAAGDGDLWVVGGGGLAAQFATAGLLDEIVVSIAPVTLGAGRPLFGGRFDLELIDHTRNKAFLCARYKVLGVLTEDRPTGS